LTSLAKLVAGFADSQDIVYDGSDILSETISSFTRLLRDDRKMQVFFLVWWHFRRLL
jgi:hypothetical protein